MESERTKLSKEEVKEKINAGEKIEKVHIEKISISKKEMTVPIHIVDCDIESLDLNHSTFQEDVTIRRCNIKTLVLSDAVFEKKCDFKKSRVGRGRAQRAAFKGAAVFSEANLSYTSFHESVFDGKADFGRCTFTGDATFTGVDFKDQGNFDHVQFCTSGMFKNSHWKDKAKFTAVEVANDLNLSDSHFEGPLFAAESVVRLSIDLSHSRLEGFTDFSNCSAGRSILLLGVKSGENQGFRFRNATSPLILLEREAVEGHVYPENKEKYSEAAKEYGFLRSTFQKINRFDDEDWAYYQFKRMERMGTPLSFNPLALVKRFIEYFFLDLGCGYGTKPFRTLGVCLSMVLLFAFCFFVSGIPVPDVFHYNIDSKMLTRIVYSLDISLTAFSGGYGDLAYIKGSIKLLAMLEYMLGVVFMGIFIVAFSRKVIR